jgi:tRNA-Thr(GGU) m(6)t(6)A37 methyltransferase TsaA
VADPADRLGFDGQGRNGLLRGHTLAEQTMIPMHPIGHVRGGRTDAVDDDWGASRARIDLDPARFTGESLQGLDGFSHVEIVFVFDKVTDEEIVTGARHPRGRKDWPKVGIFAQRGKNRPNRIGLCTARIVAVDGLSLELEGLDAIDGTPVLDIKPVMTGFQPRGSIREPAWAGEIMKDYW